MRISRKGSVFDLFYITFAFLVVGIMFVISLFLKDQIFPSLTTMLNTSSEAVSVANTSAQGLNMLDGLFLLSFFMMNGAAVVFAALVPNNPIFAILNVIMMILLVLVTPAFSNVMQAFWSVDGMAQYAEGGGAAVTMPITTRVFQFLPALTFGISLVIMIVQYGKRAE